MYERPLGSHNDAGDLYAEVETDYEAEKTAQVEEDAAEARSLRSEEEAEVADERRVERILRVHELRDAVMQMVIRYGGSQLSYGLAIGDGVDADVRARHLRASSRRFRAVQRLTLALRDLAAS